MEMEVMRVAGTFAGHALPGSMFIAWALYWMVEAAVRGNGSPEARPLESGLFLPVAKVVVPLVGVVVEIPGEGWYPQDVMMNWQHVTMYAVFSASGVVDLLVHRGLMSREASYLAFTGANLNAGFLFWGHGAHAGVPGVVHWLLFLLFFAVSGFAVGETLIPSARLSWARRGALLALGAWFFSAAWILYVSGWDMADPVRVGWSYIVFSWTVAAASVVTVAASLLAGARSTKGSHAA